MIKDKDKDWEKILSDIFSFPIELNNTGDLEKDYLDAMNTIVKKIENNNYVNTNDDENIKEEKKYFQ